MRRLCLLLCALAVAAGFAVFAQERGEMRAPAAAGPAEEPRDPVRVEVLAPASAAAQPEEARPPAMLSVWNEGRAERVEMEEYLVHVVAGEMPAGYETEALKAQAVAARSYIAWKMPAHGGGGCSRGAGADVCADSAHCMAYLSDGEMREKWGEQYPQYRARIEQAVRETAGEVMWHGGSPVQALFHSASGGRTEDAQAVWGTALPYLKSVHSGGEEDSAQYSAVRRMSRAELAQALNAAFDGAGLDADSVETGFTVRSRTDSGRADVVRVGAVTATGRAVRAALDLNSANFTVQYEGDEAILTTRGYGHGVGMSQVGANAMAQEGEDYRSILTHYYTGVSIGPLTSGT